MALAKERHQKEEEHRARMDEVQRKKIEIAREEERTKRVEGFRRELSDQTRISSEESPNDCAHEAKTRR